MKPWAYAAIVLAVLAAFGGTYAKGYSSGYAEKENEVQGEILEAVAKAEQDRDNQWAAAVAAAQENIRVEERVVTEIQYVEKEIPKVVKEIVTVRPECRDLGPDYAGLLSNQVRAANGLQSPPAPASVVD